MLDSILIATDGSEQASTAVEHGLDLAETLGAKVHVIYVVETAASYILTVGVSDEEMKKYREYGETVVTDVVDRADERGLDGVGVVKSGKIAPEIAEYAEEENLDAIILGKSGSGAIDKYLGSTAKKVVRLSSAPVTIVRSP